MVYITATGDFMWIKSYSKTYQGIKREDIWRLWTDVNNWAQWHDDLDYCKMDDAFSVGNYFLLKPKGGPVFKIELTEIKEGWEFTDCTKLFGARMYDSHKIEENTDGSLRLTSTLKVTGPLKWLWILLVAKNVAATAPQEMEAAVKMVSTTHV